jgi:hypothetical protein
MVEWVEIVFPVLMDVNVLIGAAALPCRQALNLREHVRKLVLWSCSFCCGRSSRVHSSSGSVTFARTCIVCNIVLTTLNRSEEIRNLCRRCEKALGS